MKQELHRELHLLGLVHTRPAQAHVAFVALGYYCICSSALTLTVTHIPYTYSYLCILVPAVWLFRSGLRTLWLLTL